MRAGALGKHSPSTRGSRWRVDGPFDRRRDRAQASNASSRDVRCPPCRPSAKRESIACPPCACDSRKIAVSPVAPAKNVKSYRQSTALSKNARKNNGERGAAPGPRLESRYRRALLERLGHPFEVAAADVDETAAARRDAGRHRLRLADRQGTRRSRRRYSDALVIGSDQVADCRRRGAQQAGEPRRRRSRSSRCSRAAGSSSTPRVALIDAASKRCQLRAGRRGEHLPPARPRRRSTATCAASSPTTAPERSSPRRWASRCSSASKATIRPR